MRRVELERRPTERPPEPARPEGRNHRGARRALGARFARTFALVLVALLGLRLALPSLVRRYVERVLAGTEGYSGTVAGVDLDLWRGAYALTDVELHREGGSAERPFLVVARMDLSVQWSSLARGRVVAEAVLHQPRLELVVEGGTDEQTGKEEESWSERMAALVPFRIDRFVVRDGELRFRHEGVEPPVDLFVTDTFVELLNLTNERVAAGEQGPMAEAELAGRPFGTGELESRLRFDVLSDPPRFELDAVVRRIELSALNDFLQAYGKVDAESGELALFAEFAAADGRVEGYVKTLVQGLEVASVEEIDGPGDLLHTLWEGFVALGAELLENQPRDRIAVQIPLRGRLSDLGTDLGAIVVSLLRNAFVAALRPAIDDAIELRGVEIVRADERPRGAGEDGR